MAGTIRYIGLRVLRVPTLCLLFAGCGGGGGGASANAHAPAASISDVIVTASGEDAFTIGFRLTPVPEPLRVTLAYSEDLGASFRESASVSGQVELDEGLDHGEIRWQAANDIGTAPQGDLLVRVTPHGAHSGTSGTPADSSPFAYGANSAPAITAVAAAASPSGSPVTFTVSGADPDGDTVLLDAWYSTDKGRTFSPAAAWGPIRFAAEGTTGRFRWNAFEALGEGEFSNVVLKVVARDAASQGERASAGFDLVTFRPRVAGITIEDVPLTMNGSRPFTNLDGEEETYRLLVPSHGFTLQLYYEANPRSAPIDPASLELTTSCAIGPAGAIAAGTNLGALCLSGEDEAALALSRSLALPPGAMHVRATISDLLGNTSEACTYEFVVERKGEAFQPFARTEIWALVLTRDGWSITAECDKGTVTVTPTFGANGTPDFIEDLALVGLYDRNHVAESERAVTLVEDRIVANLYGFFVRPADGVLDRACTPIAFTLSAPDGTSTIGVGGADPVGGYTLGRANFDRGNSHDDQNVTASLGVFSTNLIRFYINASSTFRRIFDDFIPGRGQPVGTAPEDARVLSDAFVPDDPANTHAENERYAALIGAAEGFGRAIAAIVAHEIGHSLGLVANGPPPEGLFGGEQNAEFAGRFTDPYHLDTPGNNIMESSISFTVTQYTDTRILRFNALNMAYLLERVLVRR